MTKHLLKLNLKRWLLCISTSFRVLHAPESWLKYFFSSLFKLSCSCLTLFSEFLVFSILVIIRFVHLMEQKEAFTLKLRLSHANGNKKAWKRQKKFISTSFWVRAAPEIWSKYTTDVQNRRLRSVKKYSDLVKTNGEMSLRNIDINWTINWIVHRHWELCDCKQIFKIQFLKI